MGHIVCPRCAKRFVISDTNEESEIMCDACGQLFKIQEKSNKRKTN